MSDLYSLIVSPSAFGGQTLRASVAGDGSSLESQIVAITEAKTYHLWARVLAFESSASFYAGIQGEGVVNRVISTEGAWTWVLVDSYELSSGVYTVVFGPGSLGVYVDTLVLTELVLTPGQINTRLGGAPGGLLPPSGVGGGDGSFDLMANTAFSDANRALKDGTPFTSLMEEIYDGVLWYLDNDMLREHGDDTVAIERSLAEGNSYDVGRHIWSQYSCLMVLYRLTGDLRLLDEMTRLAKVAYSQGMRTTWVPGAAVLSSGHKWHREPHGERFFPWLNSGAPDYWGHDYHLMDTTRSLRPFAQLALALDLNRGLTSPAGHNYGAEADKWADVMEGYLRVWSKVDDSSFASNMRVPEIYRGWYNNGSYIRAEADQWPVNFRGLTHPNHAAGAMSLYLGRLLGKEAVGVAGLMAMYEPFLEDEVLFRTENGREHAFWGHGMGTWTGANYYAQPIVYLSHTLVDLIDLTLDGALSDYDMHRVMRGLAHSYSYWSMLGGSSFSSLLGDMQGEVPRTGTSISGRTATIPVDSGRGPYNGFRATHMGHGMFLGWDTTGRMRDLLVPEWLDSWTDDGWSTPKSLNVPVGVFMDEAGIG